MSKITTQDYHKLATSTVYENEDKLRKKLNIKPNDKLDNSINYYKTPDKIEGSDKKIIARQHTQSGMDAMAVQDSEGKITIVYGGTHDFGDVGTDVQLSINNSPDEFNDADNFFKEVSKHYNVKKKILKQLDIHLQVH